MSNHRCNRVPGGTYFFTVNLRVRRSNLLVTEIAALCDAVTGARAKQHFHIDAWVVLPDHIHCMWTLPPGDADFAGRWQKIKIAFSTSMPATEERSSSRLRRGERGIWQRRYWEHTVRDDRDYRAHMDDIHFNPVKHGLVPAPAAWPYSTFHRCVGMGLYPEDWAGGGADMAATGERR